MKWIPRERLKIDRVACPWLVSRFIDTEAEFLFVPAADVVPQATGTIPLFAAEACARGEARLEPTVS